jgi:hypothetical protein
MRDRSATSALTASVFYLVEHLRTTGYPTGPLHCLFVGIDGAFILRTDFFAIPPLPVVVAVVVNLLDRDRGLRRDVVREVVGPLVDLVLLRFFLEAGLASFVLGQFLGVAGNVLELVWGVSVERIDNVCREFRWRRRWFVGHWPTCVNQHWWWDHSFVG